MKSRSYQNVTVRAAVAAILGTAGMVSYSPIGLAGEEASGEIEEVTVTGSRIVRRDYESNSPLVTVDSEALENRTGLNMESYLNQLPNFNPATTPVTSQGDVQITPVNSVGISSVSLRGFGPNRNLVLVDGHRTVPVNPLMVTDLNGIPSALVERVEIISGGASAVYGADAIGGVTNMILRDNFEGLEADVQFGMAEVGDAQESRVYAIFGTNFADGRGNVTMGAEWYNRDKGFTKNRDFYTKRWNDPTVGGDFFLFGYNGYASQNGGNTPNINAVNAIFRNRPTYPLDNPPKTPPTPGQGLQSGVCNFNSCVGADFRFNDDQSVFINTGNNSYKFLQGGGVVDGKLYAYQDAYDVSGTNFLTPGIKTKILKWNNDEALILGPQERHSLYGSGSFDITEHLQFWARGMWAESTTKTTLLPTDAIAGWEAMVAFNPTTDSPVNPSLDYTNYNTVVSVLTNPAANANPGFIPTGTLDPDGTGPRLGAQHPVPVDLAVLLLSRPAATRSSPWMVTTYPDDSFPQRQTTNTISTWNVETGLRFDLPVSDWTGEAYYAHGESTTYNAADGNLSLTRWRNLVTQLDYARGLTLEANTAATNPGQPPPVRPNFGGAIIHCTSGYYDNFFKGDGPISQDCKDAVYANLQTHSNNVQDIASLDFQGGLFNLPAGQVRAAVGAEWRSNASTFTPDILQSTSSFMDQVVGVYPTGYLDASTSVTDIYGELLVPIISDLPGLQKVELELGGRYSDYEDTDSTWTYKALANVQFTNWLRLRGGYNRATRAPNLGELFLNVQEIFTIGGANYSDACSARSTSPYGAAAPPSPTTAPDPIANPGELPPTLASGQTLEGAQSTYLICQAQMGAAGSNFYYTQTNAVGGAGSAFNWVLQQGNPNLKSEVADTWTVGLVIGSPFTASWISGTTLSIDWWSVDIKDAIQQYSLDYAGYLCYGTHLAHNSAEAAAAAASPECQNVARDQFNGAALETLLEYSNLATIKTSGIDVSLNWRAMFSDIGLGMVPGAIGFNMNATWLDYYKTKQSPLPLDIEIDWAGSLGPTLAGTNPGAYEYRIFAGLNYSLDKFNASFRWRHTPSVLTAAKAQENAIIKHNEQVASGKITGNMLSYTPTAAIMPGAYDIFDLSFNYDINDTFSVRAGIDNVFDVQPEITGKTAGRPYDNSKTAAENTAVLQAVCSADAKTKGCVAPFGYSLASTGQGTTSPGFYDTIGRRFFVGVKMRF